MNPKIKGIALSTVATMLGFYIMNLIMGVAPSLIGILIVGGSTGLIAGSAIALIRGGELAIPVGIATTCLLWFGFTAIMVEHFGTSGFDVTKFLISTVPVAVLGVIAGFGYKLGAR